uniref:Dolichol kinase n=1 Tax=Chlamydomonas euryale TaxID=1486919 RepID=A0A7R9VI42_9CHLO|mmetsp:Transcript_36023/g.106508  ORF Transcript_36023/g.106508 Transcript_36023/m.106508 type:complete len:252 (+) Transcript_36023:70-825(+)
MTLLEGMQDAAALAMAVGLTLAIIKSAARLQSSRLLSGAEARKVTHVGCGLTFLLSWMTFSNRPEARYWAATAVALPTIKIFMVGLGLLKDENLVQSMTRKNELSELLYGPLLYGIVSAAWTVIWWRDSPIGLVGLIALFAGDGCAGFFGVRYGHVLGTLPHNPNKTWIGSIAFVISTFVVSAPMIFMFNSLGLISNLAPGHPDVQNPWPMLMKSLVLVSFLSGASESLDVKELDNVTVPTVASLFMSSMI